MTAATDCVLVQAASGVTSFCKIILVLRALLQHYCLAPVLDLLLDHIHFEEFVLAGASASLEAPNHMPCTLHLLLLSEEFGSCTVEVSACSQPK